MKERPDLMQKILQAISGSRDLSLEHRVYNILAFTVIGVSFSAALLNAFLGIHWMTTVLGFSGCGIAMILYYVSRFRGYFGNVMIYVMMFAGLVILAFIYPFDGGSNGPWIFVILTIIIVFVIISPGERAQILVIAFWLTYVLSLYIVEFFNADWVMHYPSREARLLDMMITFSFALTLMGITIIAFKRNYNREREKVSAQNEELSRKNQQIEILMKELNHRVKNNLQVVTSLLNLQSARIKDPDARNAVLDGRNRLLSMVLIHQKLYQNDRPTEVNMNEYLIELANNVVMNNRSTDTDALLSFSIENIDMKVEHAVPVGLIVNELVTNAVKHAFSTERIDDRISVKFQKKAGRFTLSVSDNGKGLIAPAKESFGLQLVRSLVEQLDGDTEIGYQGGATVSIHFSTPNE